MYGSRSRKVKTDKRDAAALAETCRTGIYRPAHRASAAARDVRRRVRVRSHLVRQRSQTISLRRSLLRQEGLRVAPGSAERILKRLDQIALPAALAAVVSPLRAIITQLNALLVEADTALDERAIADPITQHLMTAPGVGPIVALTFQAVMDTPARFGGDAGRASAFLGLVPSEDSSAERQHKGSITKAGPREPRALLVQASWVIWRGRSAAGTALRAWAQALARRLSCILYALWRDRKDFRASTTAQAA